MMSYYLNVHFQGERVNLAEFTVTIAWLDCKSKAWSYLQDVGVVLYRGSANPRPPGCIVTRGHIYKLWI